MADKATLLIIDDDASLRRFASLILCQAGHEVHEAADGVVGIKLLESISCDVVITDLLMPNKEGIETCRELRSAYADLRLVAMSGSPDAATYFTILKHMGVCATLHKPFSADELRATVRSVLAAS